MKDRISEILSAHIALANKQLEYMRAGTKFDDVAGALPAKESELIVTVANLEAALDRHQARNA